MTAPDVPVLRQVVLDCRHPRSLAEFYRELLGYAYRPGDKGPAPGEPDPRGHDWLVIRPPDGGRGIAFQADEGFRPPVWSPEREDLDEPLYVFADPAGHPFYIFVA